jgi:acyl-CoA synthetase (AMP-forming)/AMP-acid ligase II
MFDFEAVRHMADITRHQAAVRPDGVALTFKGRLTTFGALDRLASQIANGLIEAGVEPGDRVAAYAANSDLYIALFFGCVKARATLVGVNARLAPPEVAFVLDDSKAKALFVGAHFAAAAPKALAHAQVAPLVIGIDAPLGDSPTLAAWAADFSAQDPRLAADPDDDVIQLYTSGTTGLPKGVQITDAAYLRFFRYGLAADWADYAPGDAVLVAMPLFHVAGINTAILSVAQGAKGVVLEAIDPAEILRLIPAEKIRHAFFAPTIINMLMQVPGSESVDYSSLERVFYGASPIAEDLLRRAQARFGCSFTQLYGMTESLGAGTYLPPEDHAEGRDKLRSCGKPWPGFQIECRRADGTACAPGEVGEIVMTSDCLMKAYWNRQDATADTIRDGWLHTGDAGYFDEEGYLYIHDRVKDMIVSGGENVYPAEVENAIFGHPAVADVAVIGVPDEKWGEAVKAIIVPKPGAVVEADSIIAYARERIAGYKAPKSIDVIDALPRNPSGKILRRELREPYWAGHTRRVS